jgi:chromosome segregation ATPase
VIETAMVFALGVLVAALLALLVLPALSRRAERLARRRVEARFPASLAEIAAERDHFRAELAVEARRLEQRAAAIERQRVDDMAELGRRALAIADLRTDLAARIATIAAVDRDIGATRGALEQTSATLETTLASLRETTAERDRTADALATLEGAHRRLEALAEERRLTIAALETTGESLRARIGELERDGAEARSRAAADAAEARIRAAADATRIAELETGVAVLERRVAALQQERDDRDRLIETLRAERQGLTDRLAAAAATAAERDRQILGLTARSETAEATAERVRRDEHAATSSLAMTLETLRAEKAAAEGALAAARDDRHTLQQELNALRQAGDAATAAQRLENAALREQLDAIASDILALGKAGQLSPPPPPPPPGPGRRRTKFVAVGEASSPANSPTRSPANDARSGDGAPPAPVVPPAASPPAASV